VNAGREPLFGRYAREESSELRSLLLVECSAERCLVLPRQTADLLQDVVPRAGQIKRMGPSVGGVVPPLDQTALFQFIDNRDQAARKDAQLLTQSLLTEAVRLLDHPEYAGVRWLEPQRLQTLPKPGRGVCADLRQQKGQPGCLLGRRALHARPGHSLLQKIVIDINDSRRYYSRSLGRPWQVGYQWFAFVVISDQSSSQLKGAWAMRLNHLNLTVPDVARTREFFENYFGFRCVAERGRGFLAVLVDESGFVLTLNNFDDAAQVQYPGAFHIGFMQETREHVDGMYERLRAGGFNPEPPKEFHGAWTFYFRAPGGFLVEVGHQHRRAGV
jgi:catechol 2,3-dioxygenase-like lactoylglutathione lyase family enzyme